MRLDPNPLFRRIIAPWYDSSLACWLGLAAMVVVAWFAVIGVVVAGQHAAYSGSIMLPWLLFILSVLVIVSVAGRLIQRLFTRGAVNGDKDA